MGYACPVCGAPQRDAEHLANHLAFTAMLHGDGHEVWLDDHAPGWADAGPDELGARVAPRAEETTYEAVFEDTAHDHDRGRPFEGGVPGGARPTRTDAAPADEATRAALSEARELTRAMREGDDDGASETDGADAPDDEEKA